MGAKFNNDKVREIIETFWNDRDISTTEIANSLNSSNLSTPSGCKWQGSNVSGYAINKLKLPARRVSKNKIGRQKRLLAQNGVNQEDQSDRKNSSDKMMKALGNLLASDIDVDHKKLIYDQFTMLLGRLL